MQRTRRAAGVALGLALLLMLLVVGMPTAQAASTLGISKTASVDVVRPGEDFRYTIVPRCSGLTEACVNARFVDVLPPALEVTALPPSNADRLVTYDPATRRLEVTFRIPLPPPSPDGALGLSTLR